MICLKDAKPLKFNAAKSASEWLEKLRENTPSWSSCTHLAFSVLALDTVMVIGLYLWPFVVKCAIHSFVNIHADLHHMWLKIAT